MIACIRSGGVVGVEGFGVLVECDVSTGLNAFEVVGLAETAVRESRVRVRSALESAGIDFPSRRITVNLAPADVPKRGTLYDLPIALAVLTSDRIVPAARLEEYMAVGELSLSGEVRPVPGVLPMVLAARKMGLTGVLVPADNAAEAASVPGIDVLPVRGLQELIAWALDDEELEPVGPAKRVERRQVPDMEDVRGQEWAKRALLIAAAGGHNVLMFGPPGSGKTMLARRLPGILPEMSLDEQLETTKIYSVSGLLRRDHGLVTQRPFRSPHHTVSNAALVGGGSVPRPGEVSLAHNGVLFLDEFPEFPRTVLEVLRQPLEDREVTIARAQSTCRFPANLALVAAMNPCPCGYRGDERRKCSCDDMAVMRYLSRMSGPLLDRIDMHVAVRSVPIDVLEKEETGEASTSMRRQVERARQRQRGRGVHSNALLAGSALRRHAKMDDEARAILTGVFDKMGLSARSYDRILKVALTIADLEGAKTIRAEHVSEAVRYRQLDQYLHQADVQALWG